LPPPPPHPSPSPFFFSQVVEMSNGQQLEMVDGNLVETLAAFIDIHDGDVVGHKILRFIVCCSVCCSVLWHVLISVMVFFLSRIPEVKCVLQFVLQCVAAFIDIRDEDVDCHIMFSICIVLRNVCICIYMWVCI